MPGLIPRLAFGLSQHISWCGGSCRSRCLCRGSRISCSGSSKALLLITEYKVTECFFRTRGWDVVRLQKLQNPSSDVCCQVVYVQVGSSFEPQHLLFLGHCSSHISLPHRDHLLLESIVLPSLLLGVLHPHYLSFAFVSEVRMSPIFHSSTDGTHPISRMTPIATVKM